MCDAYYSILKYSLMPVPLMKNQTQPRASMSIGGSALRQGSLERAVWVLALRIDEL